jgi:hypothetical protein
MKGLREKVPLSPFLALPLSITNALLKCVAKLPPVFLCASGVNLFLSRKKFHAGGAKKRRKAREG